MERQQQRLSYDFTLRSDVTFHDGTPLDATAVCANFNRWFTFPEDLRKQAPGISFQSVFKAYSDQPVFSIFKDCKVVSASDVRINLTRPFTGFLQALTLPAFAISSPTALQAQKANVLDQVRNGQAMSSYAGHPVGTARTSSLAGTRRNLPCPATRATGGATGGDK